MFCSAARPMNPHRNIDADEASCLLQQADRVPLAAQKLGTGFAQRPSRVAWFQPAKNNKKQKEKKKNTK